MDRRAFLQMIGLGTAGVAFNSAIKSPIWELPKHLMLSDGLVTPEWIAAEALRVLCENFEFPERQKSARVRIPADALQNLGVTIRNDEYGMLVSRSEYRERFIEPSMLQLSGALTEREPKIFLPMESTFENCHLVTHPGSGLNLRYLTAYDLGSAGYEDANGNWIEAYSPPGIIARMDLLFAA